jgi:hypothetical protein
MIHIKYEHIATKDCLDTKLFFKKDWKLFWTFLHLNLELWPFKPQGSIRTIVWIWNGIQWILNIISGPSFW